MLFSSVIYYLIFTVQFLKTENYISWKFWLLVLWRVTAQLWSLFLTAVTAKNPESLKPLLVARWQDGCSSPLLDKGSTSWSVWLTEHVQNSAAGQTQPLVLPGLTTILSSPINMETCHPTGHTLWLARVAGLAYNKTARLGLIHKHSLNFLCLSSILFLACGR